MRLLAFPGQKQTSSSLRFPFRRDMTFALDWGVKNQLSVYLRFPFTTISVPTKMMSLIPKSFRAFLPKIGCSTIQADFDHKETQQHRALAGRGAGSGPGGGGGGGGGWGGRPGRAGEQMDEWVPCCDGRHLEGFKPQPKYLQATAALPVRRKDLLNSD